MEFSQAIFVNGLFRKLQVSTPLVLCLRATAIMGATAVDGERTAVC